MQSSLDQLRVSAADLRNRTENEAETRHKLIDVILHDVLAWPRNRLFVEQHIHPGFADYILRKPNGDDIIFIEAKKAGVYFTLPIAHKLGETASYIPIRILLSDPPIEAAMTQVRNYCIETGCDSAAITNGHEWVFFRTFEKGKRWDAQQAFVIRSEQFFLQETTRAYNTLSYHSIIENASLSSLLTSSPPKDRALYYAKDRIPAYSHAITANKLASALRPIVNHYFGIIEDSDTEFMDRCYVSQRDYQVTLAGMRNMMEDAVTPYLARYNVQQLDETGKGGRLGGRLTKNIRKGRSGEVLVLFGGKGAGKSTFIKRLLRHNPPPWLREHSVIAIIDLLKVPEDAESIRSAIWSGLVTELDRDNLLDGDRDQLIKGIFKDKYKTALKQDLAGLRKDGAEYNQTLNSLVASWRSDNQSVALALSDYWKENGKGVVVVIDNTDQYAGANQDYCFTSAQSISDTLSCVTLISMREERFYNSKIHGVLDAFQNAGFHISSPRPAEVFRRRLSYTTNLLRDEDRRADFMKVSDQMAKDCASYLSIILREFGNDASPLNAFLTACAHGDTRLSLDLFRSFLLSGYTNVEEMLEEGRWNFQIHQILKPVMIPNRYFYDETVSDIPNIYQLRYSRHCSHFTALRVLRKLAKSMDGSAPAYISVAQLKSYFVETFNMLDDFTLNLDLLLKHGFVEADNRLDNYSESLDSVKITAYGRYMHNDMAFYFAYLDLICVDCGVFDQQTSNYLTEAANEEYNMFIRGSRKDRVSVRLDRVEAFIKYLMAEEAREVEYYKLGISADEMFTHKAAEAFQREKTRVLASAQRQVAKWQTRGGGRRHN